MKKYIVITTLVISMGSALQSDAHEAEPILLSQVTPPPATVTGVPGDTNNAATNALQPLSIVTISQTFTNSPNILLIIGTVSSEQEKQSIQTQLQQAAPGKTINNQLTVSPAVSEPSGAQPGTNGTNQGTPDNPFVFPIE